MESFTLFIYICIYLTLLYTYVFFNDFFIFEKDDKYKIDESKILFIYCILL